MHNLTKVPLLPIIQILLLQVYFSVVSN